MKLRSRSSYVAMACALIVSAGAGLSGGGAGAQEPDPLLADSLAALTALVDEEVCTEMDAADGDVANGVTLPYRLCDDGIPPEDGGTEGIPVPVKYAADENGNDWTGLPAPAPHTEVAQADTEEDLQPESGNRITLDVDISLPPADSPAPRGGRPVIVLMHGCCGGNKASWEATSIDAAREHWHHNNAWWAARGYVVITYTARGFRDSNNRGSTGTTQLDSRRYEVNDYQYLVGLLADHDRSRRAIGGQPIFNINPKRIAAVGGSYGGGFSWLALTDPTWKSPEFGVKLQLRAAVPKYGWTDLVEALVPSGRYFDVDPKTKKTFIAPSTVAKALSRNPIGVEKQSIVSGLYATGNLASGNHTTFPEYMHEIYARLQQGEPYDGDAVMNRAADSFLTDRSAYFQNDFWKRVKKGLRVPLYVPATWTDPLFPTIESVRFYNKLTKVAPKYPVSMYVGDYQHFVANKATEWGDLCGDDHHVCTLEDYTLPNLTKAPTRVREGINSKINKFLDHYLKARGKKPVHNVTATTTICAGNATDKYPVAEPGIEYRAPTWRALAPKFDDFSWVGGGMSSSAALDAHAADSDPVARDRQTDKCFTTDQTNPGTGVIAYPTEPIKKSFTMIGMPILTIQYTTSATDYWVAAKMFDKAPDGTLTMVTRGLCRMSPATETDCSTFALFGNAWTFEKDHQIVVEVGQSDTPFLRKDNFPSTITFNSAKLEWPVAPKKLRHDFRG